MKIAVLFAFLVLTVAADKYSPENDEIDISILSDEKIKEFAACFNYGQPCDPLASAFQKDLREAIEQLCAKCTDAQKLQIKHFLERLILKFPKEYQVFSKKYDPDSKHLVALQSMLSKL